MEVSNEGFPDKSLGPSGGEATEFGDEYLFNVTDLVSLF